mmetsp:Transcript_24439/g.55100  ORF Transcript_24439/g.55100 Transcript_24439/m.55100 type:complete len:173 (+) Transcript_24439:223-741(+)|eukprot:CAMPEP_0172604790 /NCGR_PEP_ID=MMETSP1068-20121228/25049_1 /TAXON_ID=35684 /ORGANISM="Pseudopedinella elastica, Strain CCMP716" /LENGTH=172 /DNA_ID=CAMNT_0013406977 /DNA_START=124 /DNA_END=642 /DNA_ORIENTATION=+
MSRICWAALTLFCSSGHGYQVPRKWWPVNVRGDFGSETHQAWSNEPLLNLFERAGLRPPSECRRGNCLSCTAKLAPGSTNNFATDQDSFLCDEARAAGFVLMCCSYPTGPGLLLELEKSDEVLRVQFNDRYGAHEEGVKASAKTITDWAKNNPREWKRATEELLMSSEDDSA